MDEMYDPVDILCGNDILIYHYGGENGRDTLLQLINRFIIRMVWIFQINYVN